jgi:hypothetical protein
MQDGNPGYSAHHHVFDRTEMVAALAALTNAALGRSRAGARHVLGIPAVRELASDPRLIAVATRFVGPQPVPFRATLFDKSAASNWLVAWHQDTALPLRARIDDAEWGPWSTKAGVLYAHAPAWALEKVVALRVHLDDSTPSNGPLRVLPATHLAGVLTDAEIERMARVVTPVDCLADAGGVVAMRPLAVHASSKATDANPRRVLHFEYAAGVQLGSGIELHVG